VVVPCSFIPSYYFTPKYIVWFKCDASKTKCVESDMIFHTNPNKFQSEFKGRVSLLEPDVSQRNCSIIINDLKKSDSGTYQIRVNGLLLDETSGITFYIRSPVSVRGLSQKPTVEVPPLMEGQQATLTCTAPGLCSGSRPEITWTWRGTRENSSQFTGNITDFHTENLTAVAQRHSSTLTFDPSSEHHGTSVTCRVSFTGGAVTEETVTLNVSYVKEVKIIGATNVREGETLNLTCSVDSFPPSDVMWTKFGADNLLKNNSSVHLQEEQGISSVSISNVTVDVSGLYMCMAKHVNKTLSKNVNVTVTWFSKVLNSSGCVHRSKTLTCVCISEGLPLPTIRWPLLKNHTGYMVITTVSNNTINSTVSLSVENGGNMSVECFSSHENGEAKENLTVKHDVVENLVSNNLMGTAARVEVVIAFLIGVLLSAIVCCLGSACNRMKQKKSEHLDETLEMMNIQHNQTKDQEGTENGAVAAEKVLPEPSCSPNDVEYASIDFSKLKTWISRKKAKELESMATEYAEIKIGVKEETKVNKEVETLEGKEEEPVMDGEEKTKDGLDEQGGQGEAVYSTVKDVMDEI
ncbi:sialic acid-binding Ig-like lectin 5, partial [Nematolebias whitei]|uniref:sialic acid-binding Ig-like lectin 5 n=1 Tax=Nematolebias whitei TaxID=451745 RepID=UPI00189A4064